MRPGLRGGAAQGSRGTCGLAGVLLPWHNGCHGSRVWCDFLFVDVYRPPFGDGPHGSLKKGQRGFEPTLAFYVTKIFKER